MNDEFLLGLMKAGFLKVDAKERVNVWHPSWKRWVTKSTRDRGDGRRRYSFHHPERNVSITVGRNRLLLLWKLRRPIDGVADHMDVDRTNDSLDNLQEMSQPESDRQGWEQQMKRRVQEVGDWFDTMSKLDGVT